MLFGTLHGSTLDNNGMFMWDEAMYGSIARSVLEGDGFPHQRSAPPVATTNAPPLSSAVAMGVLGSDTDVTAKLPVLVYSLLALCIVYWMVRRVEGTVAATIATFALGIFPSYWIAGGYMLTEIPFIAFQHRRCRVLLCGDP